MRLFRIVTTGRESHPYAIETPFEKTLLTEEELDGLAHDIFVAKAITGNDMFEKEMNHECA